MQNYLIHRATGDLDIMNHASSFGALISEAVFDSKTTKGTTYDVIISSAHDAGTAIRKSKDSKLVAVISYIPSIDDHPEDWATFYTNLCMCDAYACDRFVKKELGKITFPMKRWISLEGCQTLYQPNPMPIKEDQAIKLFALDIDRSGWSKLADFVVKDKERRFQIVTSPVRDAVGVALYPIGSNLANYMQAKLRYITVAYDEDVSPYLDCRQGHTFGEAMQRFAHIPGQSTAKPVNDLLTTFCNELLMILGHAQVKPVHKFTSNAFIYDRIFMELNRSV